MNECAHCGAEDAPEDGIVVGKTSEGGDSTCNVCLHSHLHEGTSLSNQEAHVAALKMLGYSHASIADLLQDLHKEPKPAKSTVDEYSSRINTKIDRAKQTYTKLEPLA
ncbi:hypothetical protein [Halobaculum sp. EA56]|uniref:hypothetical protein n=1 Tax=Halobaculum sp. EA56 TaxID=3421648 RepID=UPI003EC0A409